ncbi:MAG: hypothetical protein ABJ327_11635 [Litoreibacter sp.]
MTDTAPYFVDISVPEKVILGRSEPVLNHPNIWDAVWYRAAPSAMHRDDNGAVQEWRPDAGVGTVATPSKPNTNHSRCAPDGGLVFQAGINAGFVIKDGLVEPPSFSCAIRYRSEDGEARSLITINPNEENTYLFLTEKDRQIYWQDQQGLVSLSLPAPQDGWVAAGYSQGKLSLTVAQHGEYFGPILRSDAGADKLRTALSGSSDVFIGCRSHRGGIKKTLGSSTIHDILIWIDRDINTGDRLGLEAVRQYCERKTVTDDF